MRKERENKNGKKERRMKVTVSLPRRSPNKGLEVALIKATRFFAKELMSTRMRNTLKIKIHVRKTVLETNTAGRVFHNTKGSRYSQKEFLIQLQDELTNPSQLEILAHEMVHIQQNVSKRLQYRTWASDRRLHVRWEGVELGVRDHIPYREQPWEVEAYKKQEPLALKFLKHERGDPQFAFLTLNDGEKFNKNLDKELRTKLIIEKFAGKIFKVNINKKERG